MDTTAVLTAIAAVLVSVGVVGVAILGVKVGTVAFSWVNRVIK